MIKVVDGIRIEGSLQHIKDTLTKLGYKYYESASKGLVLLSEMDDYHLRNALIKRSKELLDDLRNETPEQVANRLNHQGMYIQDKEVEILATELRDRFSKFRKEQDDLCEQEDYLNEDDYDDYDDYYGDYSW